MIYVYVVTVFVVWGIGFWWLEDVSDAESFSKADDLLLPVVFAALVWPMVGLIALGWYLASKTKDVR